MGPLPVLTPGLTVFGVQSDPRKADSDTDGLPDPEEYDGGTQPLRADSDADGLSDGTEAEISTDPLDSDTDDDTFADGFEDAHRADQGLDPLHVDVKVSRWSYAADYAKGALAGDLWRADSLAWLAGNLTSGAASFIPVVGWIVGGIADLRDAIGSAIRADWVGSGLSLAGVVPYVGDAVAIPGKAAKFVVRNVGRTDEVLAYIAKLDSTVPTSIKAKALEQVLGAEYRTLKSAGMTDDALLTLARGRTDIRAAAAILGRTGATKGVPGRFFATGKAGEQFLENLYGATVTGVSRQVWFPTKLFSLGRGRYVDVLDSAGVMRESKVGYVRNSSRIRAQIAKDAKIVADRQNFPDVTGVTWHFFASGRSNTIGADKAILDLLDANRIPYVIHLPS